MSKSNDFLPGAKERLKGTYVQCTAEGLKPSCFATAYAVADSKPFPVEGSLTFQKELFVPPAYHGGYAGLSVPIVSWPGLTSVSCDFAHDAAAALVVVGVPELPPHPAVAV